MEHSISRDVRPPGGTEFVSRHLERACLSDQSAFSLSWRRPRAESIMLGVRHQKEGKLRVTYAHWDDAKVVLDGHVFRVTGRSTPSPPSKNRRGCAPNYGTTLCPKHYLWADQCPG